MTRKEAKRVLKSLDYYLQNRFEDYGERNHDAMMMAIKALNQEPCDDKGEISDGYHTFNQLYHQRAILFATIVNQNKDKGWKSYKHSDGKYCFDSNGEWFIVGVDTPKGSYTYHYSKEYWDMFDCKELECGKEWDGHTEENVTRLLSLGQEPCEDAISREQAKSAIRDRFKDLPSRVEINTILNELPSVATSYNSIKTELKSCEDCISRQTVLDKINEICFSRKQEWVNYRVSQGSHGQRDLIINFIEDLPSVQPKPQPKTGHWISCGDIYMCSECDSVGVDYDNYCPNCGTRMERGE